MSEQNAKVSETKAKTSETNAKDSETKALTSEQNAKVSETKAKTSETNAKDSETKALTSEQNAKVSETKAKTSETNAKDSETKALTSEQNAKVSETKAKTSETKAATSEAHAKTSEQKAKTSETNAKTSETNARSSEINAETAETDAARYSNSAYSSYIKSRDWAESEGSPDGEDDSLSTTGKTRSARGWAEQARSYAGSFDFSFILEALLPIGTVYMTENADFDPNETWTIGVWEKMDAGRVLISAGTYQENGKTYTYTLGDTGGEAKHQITTEEMPSHGHTATCSNDGTHNHTMGHGKDVNDRDALSQYTSTNHYLANDGTNLGYTSSSGSHSHTISIAEAGGNQLHENRMLYQVINIWKRIY